MIYTVILSSMFIKPAAQIIFCYKDAVVYYVISASILRLEVADFNTP